MSKGKEGMPENWLVLVYDTLKQLDAGMQAAFLQKFLQSLVGRQVSQEESVNHWEAILARQSQLMEKLGRAVKLGTAVVDYFEELSILQTPVLLEYEDLKKLRHNAATDPLTGLNNRRMFEEHLDQEIDRSTRYKSTFALLLFDLRKFKSVNDSYGHAAGDAILRSVARASLATIRGSDISCRIGGDEFALLLPQGDRAGTEVLAERISRKFDEYARPLAPGVPVGIDYGIAIFPEDGKDAAGLCEAADRRLYACKQKTHRPAPTLVIAPPTTAPRIEVPSRRSELVKTAQYNHPFLYPPASAASEMTEDRNQISQDRPDGRRFERVRLKGTPALGIVQAEGRSSTVEVLDASLGGVCLLVDEADLPETFKALLQVPLIPGGELTLLRIYSLALPEGKRRVGCALISVSDLSLAS
ncbi:MAG: diguanylate cyclase domain-containing protein [Terriglobia bacterium]